MKHPRNQLHHFLRDPDRRRRQNREAQERWRIKHGIPQATADRRAKARDYRNELAFRFRRTKGHKGILGRGISIVSKFELLDPIFIVYRNGKRQSEKLSERIPAFWSWIDIT